MTTAKTAHFTRWRGKVPGAMANRVQLSIRALTAFDVLSMPQTQVQSLPLEAMVEARDLRVRSAEAKRSPAGSGFQ